MKLLNHSDGDDSKKMFQRYSQQKHILLNLQKNVFIIVI